MKPRVPLKEILRLYQTERLSAKAIADRFGVTRQTISARLKNAGVVTRTIQPWAELPDTKTLQRLYHGERLTLHQVAERLNTKFDRVYQAMDKYEVPRRKPGSRDGRYPGLRKLAVGESIDLHNPSRQPHANFYAVAKAARIRVSVRRIGDRTFRVTRVQ
jgi:predicted DNA-binding protein YlxM (UPF0122 family)